MAVHQCAKCKATMEIPDDLSEVVRSESAKFLQENKQPIMAMDNLRTKAHIPLNKVKTIVTHIPRDRDTCHRCQSHLNNKDVVICAKCKALNFNW